MPRRKNSTRGVYGSLSDPYESLESRAKRLRGSSDPPAEQQAPPTTRSATPASLAPATRMPTPPVAARPDVPHVRNLRRGSASSALAGLDQLGLPQLVDELIEDRHAKTSRSSQASYRTTWAKFHRTIYGQESDTLPLTVECIVAVASLFKKGGYRGFANYISSMKSQHIEASHPWSDLLSHTVTWVTRSVERGIGPARQSCSFEFQKLAHLTKVSNPLVTGGPQQPMHLALLASLFLLREIEASTALSDAWSIDHEKCEVCWKLPASKTDHLALGVSRKLGCFCGSAMEACPYHLACEHLDWLTAQPGYEQARVSPLFPTTNGPAAPATKVVETFEELGLLMDMPPPE